MTASIDKLLVWHCAPVLAGIKVSNLFSAELSVCRQALAYNSAYNARGVYFTMLCRCKNRGLVLVYRRARLAARLREPAVRGCLRGFGYPVQEGLEAQLDFLRTRVKSMQDGFPHEIGAFLGYPLEDVIGFIENCGRDCKLCGFWKVYGDVERASRVFARYTACREDFCRRLAAGEPLASLVAV